MIDIFVCVFGDRGYRQEKVLREWDRVAREYRARLRVLVPDLMLWDEAPNIMERLEPYSLVVVDVPPPEFQRQRRIAAERFAATNIYIVADDDCTLDADEALPYALTTLLDPEHADFACVAPLPSNARIYPWTPEDYEARTTEHIMEHVNVGGIRFCRKGALPEDPALWPAQPAETEWGWKYDGPHGEFIRSRGYRSGYFRHLTMTHWGERKPVLA